MQIFVNEVDKLRETRIRRILASHWILSRHEDRSASTFGFTRVTWQEPEVWFGSVGSGRDMDLRFGDLRQNCPQQNLRKLSLHAFPPMVNLSFFSEPEIGDEFIFVIACRVYYSQRM